LKKSASRIDPSTSAVPLNEKTIKSLDGSYPVKAVPVFFVLLKKN